ncbi:MAG: hypothetical protein KGL41_03325 [Actinomycetales bacterium]|nr:hypothetical protein [Actinomycetales bacterium]
MANQKNNTEVGVSSRLERILSFMAVGLISTAVLSMLVMLVLALIHTSTSPKSAPIELSAFLTFYIQIGLSVGALCIIGIVVSNLIRRSRSNR